MNHPLKTRCLTMLLLAAALTFPGLARATGSYEVSACNYAPQGANHSWVWTDSDPSQPSHYVEHESCPYPHGASGGSIDQESGLSTTDTLHLSNGAPPNTEAAWTFTAPPNTTITAISYERYLGHILDSSNYWSPALRADGVILSNETCLDTIENSEACFIGGPPGEGGEPATITGITAHQLEYGIRCLALPEQECITGATQHAAWAAMYGTKVTLSDPQPPTLNTPSGPLWEPGQHNGYHAGDEQVTVSAQDLGGGVATITLSLDGSTIATYAAPCDYTRPQPCPTTTEAQTLTLPTSQFPDGEHTVTIVAADAAANPSTVAAEQILTANNPPPAPNDLQVTPTANSPAFTANWSDPQQAIPITHAIYQLCPAQGNVGNCTTPTTGPPQGPLTVVLPGIGVWSLSIWLENAAGYTDPSNQAQALLTFPPTNPYTTSTPPPLSPDKPENGHAGENTPPARKLHITGHLYGRELVVHINGPTTGSVRVSYTARYHHKMIGQGTHQVQLKHNRLTYSFILPARVSRRATIYLTARLAHQQAISTLTLPITRQRCRHKAHTVTTVVGPTLLQTLLQSSRSRPSVTYELSSSG
jgi:hypothetical protein